MLASVLHRAGYRVGANVSPWRVLELRERFLLDGEMISRETLAQILTEVRAVAEGLRAEGRGQPGGVRRGDGGHAAVVCAGAL